MRNSKSAILRPVSLRQKRAGLALGMSAALLAGPALAQSAEPEEVELETLRIEDKAADINPYTQKGAPYKARVNACGLITAKHGLSPWISSRFE